MNIIYKNVGTEFESVDLYLEEQDYVMLFNREARKAFGKLLNIFADLGEIIYKDPVKLRDWLGFPEYENVLKISEKICELNKSENNYR